MNNRAQNPGCLWEFQQGGGDGEGLRQLDSAKAKTCGALRGEICKGIHGGFAGHRFLQWQKLLESSVEWSPGVRDGVLSDEICRGVTASTRATEVFSIKGC